MLIGQSLLAPTTGATYYGPWFPREADKAVCVLEVMHISHSDCQITVDVRHKNSEDPDSSDSSVATFSTVSATGTYTLDTVTGLEELVRFKYTLVAESDGDQWAHIRMNPPIWRPN